MSCAPATYACCRCLERSLQQYPLIAEAATHSDLLPVMSTARFGMTPLQGRASDSRRTKLPRRSSPNKLMSLKSPNTPHWCKRSVAAEKDRKVTCRAQNSREKCRPKPGPQVHSLAGPQRPRLEQIVEAHPRSSSKQPLLQLPEGLPGQKFQKQARLHARLPRVGRQWRQEFANCCIYAELIRRLAASSSPEFPSPGWGVRGV